jgi:hypothetical protein
VLRFGQIGLSDWEVATAFGCSTRTIEQARKQEASGFKGAYKRGKAETNIALRTRLVEKALKGKTGVLWMLAVNRLGYADTAEQVINIARQQGESGGVETNTVRHKLAGVVKLIRRMARAKARKNRESL